MRAVRNKIGILNKRSHIIFIIISLTSLIIINIANSKTSLTEDQAFNHVPEVAGRSITIQDLNFAAPTHH